MKLLAIELYIADTEAQEKKFLAAVDVNVNALLPAFRDQLLIPALLQAAANARKVKQSGEFDDSDPPSVESAAQTANRSNG